MPAPTSDQVTTLLPHTYNTPNIIIFKAYDALHNLTDTIEAIYENEPNKIIAYTLSSAEFKEQFNLHYKELQVHPDSKAYEGVGK